MIKNTLIIDKRRVILTRFLQDEEVFNYELHHFDSRLVSYNMVGIMDFVIVTDDDTQTFSVIKTRSDKLASGTYSMNSFELVTQSIEDWYNVTTTD